MTTSPSTSTTTTTQSATNEPKRQFSFVARTASRKLLLTTPPRTYDVGHLDGHIAAREVCDYVRGATGDGYVRGLDLRDVVEAAVNTLNAPIQRGELCQRGAAVALLDDLMALLAFGIRQADTDGFLTRQQFKDLDYVQGSPEKAEREKAKFIAKMAAARKAKRATEVAA